MQGLSDEHFRVLYLNRRSALLDDALIAQGAVDTVHPPLRNIIARALQVNASALIAAHNHPSGAAEPSESDRLLTKDLIAACQPIGLRVLVPVQVNGAGLPAWLYVGEDLSGRLTPLGGFCWFPVASVRSNPQKLGKTL